MSTRTLRQPGSRPPPALLLHHSGQADMLGAGASLPLSRSRMGASTGGHHWNESDPSLSAGESGAERCGLMHQRWGLGWVRRIQATPLHENCIDIIIAQSSGLNYDQVYLRRAVECFFYGFWEAGFRQYLRSQYQTVVSLFLKGDICDIHLLRLQEKQVLCRMYRSSSAMTLRMESDVMLAHANLLLPTVFGTVKLPPAPDIISTNHE